MSEGLSSPAPASLEDNDDLLREILLRLPLLPSSLPRASLVCKRWRRLLSDLDFLRRFRAHHRTPPVLGFFTDDKSNLKFIPTLGRPDCIPGARFSLPRRNYGNLKLFGCRHGLVLIFDRHRLEAVVWDPMTGRQRCVAVPQELSQRNIYEGSVLGASGDGHLHGDCGFLPFKLVLVHTGSSDALVSACLYESESGRWGDISSTAISHAYISFYRPAVLVRNRVCWMLCGSGDIIEFDLDRQNLASDPEARGSPGYQRFGCSGLARHKTTNYTGV